MNVWMVIIITGVITYAIRLSFIALFENREVPPTLQRWLKYVPPAVFAAIIFPEIFVQNGSVDLSPGNARLVAGIIAALIAWRTKNVLLTILVGMTSLLIMQAIHNQY
jgi:branched-subunit amino acid transport protein